MPYVGGWEDLGQEWRAYNLYIGRYTEYNHPHIGYFMPNSNLTEAQRAKNDEFYTQYADIEKEISAYLEFNEDFDKLVDQADVEPDLPKRLPLYQQAEQIALTEVGWLPLYYGKANLLFSSKVHGLVVTPQGIFPQTDWTKVTVDK